jgi:hypothetical protein
VGVGLDGKVMVVDAKKKEVEQYLGEGGVWLKAFSNDFFNEVRYGQMSSEREKFIVLSGDSGDLAVLDPWSGDVARYTVQDAERVEFATFSGRFAAGAGAPGEFWVVDKRGERVSHLSINAMRAAPSIVSKDWKKVTGIAANAAGAVFLCDKEAKAIEVFSGSGTPLNTITDDQLGVPSDVATDDMGHLYVFDKDRSRILELGE